MKVFFMISFFSVLLSSCANLSQSEIERLKNKDKDFSRRVPARLIDSY